MSIGAVLFRIFRKLGADDADAAAFAVAAFPVAQGGGATL